MSPLILAMLGRTFGPSIARDVPYQYRDAVNFFTNPAGVLGDKAALAAAQLYGNVTDNYGPMEGVIGMQQERDITAAETGDVLRSTLSQFLPESIGKFVAPGERYYGLGIPEKDFEAFDSPQQIFRNYELMDQLAGAGELNPAYYGEIPATRSMSADVELPPVNIYGDQPTSTVELPRVDVSYTPDIPNLDLPSVDIFGTPEVPSFPVDIPTNFDFGTFDNIDFGDYLRHGGAVKRKG